VPSSWHGGRAILRNYLLEVNLGNLSKVGREEAPTAVKIEKSLD